MWGRAGGKENKNNIILWDILNNNTHSHPWLNGWAAAEIYTINDIEDMQWRYSVIAINGYREHTLVYGANSWRYIDHTQTSHNTEAITQNMHFIMNLLK